jgi:hypothetical protein
MSKFYVSQNPERVDSDDKAVAIAFLEFPLEIKAGTIKNHHRHRLCNHSYCKRLKDKNRIVNIVNLFFYCQLFVSDHGYGSHQHDDCKNSIMARFFVTMKLPMQIVDQVSLEWKA